MTGRKTLILALAFLLTETVTHAHDLGAEVRLLGDRIEVRAFFDDGTWARRAQVEMLHADTREPVASARTDEQGRAFLPRPAAGNYVIRVNAGAGHFHEEQISVPASDPSHLTEPAGSSSADGSLLSTSPTYEAKTRFPWLKLGLGLLALGAIAVVAYGVLRGGARSQPSAQR